MMNFGTYKELYEIGMKQEWCFLEHNKKLRTIVFGNWNETRINSFLEMWKSRSNVPNVFKGSPLTGHCRYWESWADIYYVL